MSEEQRKLLQRQLWSVADTLRGKMDADEFRDYMLGFIFYKYLSEKMTLYGDKILEGDKIRYDEIDERTKKGKAILKVVRDEALESLVGEATPATLLDRNTLIIW